MRHLDIRRSKSLGASGELHLYLDAIRRLPPMRRSYCSDTPPPYSCTSIVAPVAYQVILEPGIGRIREFESLRVRTTYSYEFVGTFSCAQIDLRKARERDLATLDEKSTSNGIAEPYAR